MDQLTITEKTGANYLLFECNGAINAYTISEFQQKLYNTINKSNVVLDLSEVSEIDDSGMGVIMAAFNDGEDTGHTLYLMSPSNESERAIEATGFSKVLHIISTATEVV